jgi:hypothetical protein
MHIFVLLSTLWFGPHLNNLLPRPQQLDQVPNHKAPHRDSAKSLTPLFTPWHCALGKSEFFLTEESLKFWKRSAANSKVPIPKTSSTSPCFRARVHQHALWEQESKNVKLHPNGADARENHRALHQDSSNSCSTSGVWATSWSITKIGGGRAPQPEVAAPAKIGGGAMAVRDNRGGQGWLLGERGQICLPQS